MMSNLNPRQLYDADGDDDDDDCDQNIHTAATTTSTTNATNHKSDPKYIVVDESNATMQTIPSTTVTATTSSTSTGNSSSSGMNTIPLRSFQLPDGRIMDAKNTLQSFAGPPVISTRVVATGIATTSKRDPPARNYETSSQQPIVTRGAAVVAPYAIATVRSNIPPVTDVNRTSSTKGVAVNASMEHSSNNRREETILAQAVAVHSFITSEPPVHQPPPPVHQQPPPLQQPPSQQQPPPLQQPPSQQQQPPLQQPPSQQQQPPLQQQPSQQQQKQETHHQNLTLWITIAILAIILVGVVAGVGGYCGSGNCNTSTPKSEQDVAIPASESNISSTVTITASPITKNPATESPSMMPITLPPTTAIVTPQPTISRTQLKVACDFLQLSVSQCQVTTSFLGSTVGNTIPTEIGLLTQLTYLNLYSEGLTGTIPTTFGNLTQLTYLNLWLNRLDGTIPSILGSMVSLTFLWLDNNNLTSTIPSVFGDLVRLTSLGISTNQLTGTIPSSLGNLLQLTSFYLFGNPQLRGDIPTSLCSGSFGTVFYVDCNSFVCSCCGQYGGGICQ